MSQFPGSLGVRAHTGSCGRTQQWDGCAATSDKTETPRSDEEEDGVHRASSLTGDEAGRCVGAKSSEAPTRSIQWMQA